MCQSCGTRCITGHCRHPRLQRRQPRGVQRPGLVRSQRRDIDQVTRLLPQEQRVQLRFYDEQRLRMQIVLCETAASIHRQMPIL